MDFYNKWSCALSNEQDDTSYLNEFLTRALSSLAVIDEGDFLAVKRVVDLISEIPLDRFVSAIVKLPSEQLSAVDVPCFSTFENGSSRLNQLLEFEPELSYAEIGFKLNNTPNFYAQIKYGENHSKLAEILGVVSISPQKPFLVKSSALGHYFTVTNDCRKDKIIRRMALRNKCLQELLRSSCSGVGVYRDVVNFLSDSTIYRRRTSVRTLFNFALNEPDVCRIIDNISWEL